MKDFDIFGRLSNFDERSNEDRVVIQLDYVIGAIHVDLDFMLLELFELIFLKVVCERALSSAEVASEDKKFIFASLVK